MSKRNGLVALAAAVALVVLAVAIAQLAGGSSGDGATSGTGATKEVAVQMPNGAAREELPAGVPAVDAYRSLDADGSGAAGEDAAAPPLPSLLDRKIIRDANLSLEVDDVLAGVQRVETIATGAGGLVSSSSVFVDQPPVPIEDGEPPRRTRSASVTIRVPASAYTSVLGQLREMASELLSETSQTSDVTEEFTDLEARLRNLEATESQYLKLLEKATTIDEILTVQDRINSVRLEIETVQGRINALNDLSDLATIVVALRPPALAEEPSQPGWAQEAWDEAWEKSQEVLETMGAAAIVGGVVLVWIAVPGLAILVGWRLLGPRRPHGGGAGTAA